MCICKKSALGLVLAVTLGPLAVETRHRYSVTAAVEPLTMAKTTGYENRQIEGWQIFVNAEFLKRQPDLAERTLKLLGFQLFQIARVVPPAPLEKLKSVRIWVEEKEPHHPCMTYHPDANWLREHGMSPQKARCVEIANARTFLQWTLEQPWMVLHELSHGYHHQFLKGGFRNAEVKAAYDHAMKAGLYDCVLRQSGQEERAYAATNPMEYFAEASEAYFGTNDFFPFVRIELKRHDPRGYAALEQLWEALPIPPKRPSGTSKSSAGRVAVATRKTAKGRS
jgi:hypothetical protein